MANPNTAPVATPIVVVHGGAAHFTSERQSGAQEACLAAARAALDVLIGGGLAVDAVTAAVHILEDHPDLNAATGTVLTRAETVELDASIMDGDGLRFGAVAAMPAARHPIDVARAIMDDGEHVLLCGEGARAFAIERSIALCDPADLVTERARARVAAERARRNTAPANSPGPEYGPGELGSVDPGTVGACAIDGAGHVAAATSTGGITYKRVGRIGDTPMCGAGTYADDRGGAASATGVGESIIRVTMARRCVDLMRDGREATVAAWRAVSELAADVAGSGGIICCDRNGRIGAAHNTPHMAHAAAAVVAGEPRVIAGLTLEKDADLMAAVIR